eukprot:scaffold12277_cov146-Skeletonema_menzelii.AAC.4
MVDIINCRIGGRMSMVMSTCYVVCVLEACIEVDDTIIDSSIIRPDDMHEQCHQSSRTKCSAMCKNGSGPCR